MHTEEIDLSTVSYLGILRELLHNAWMIVIVALSVFLFITGYGNLTYQPLYSVSTTLVVTDKTSNNNYSSLSIASQMAKVMGEVFQSDVMRQLVQEETGQSLNGKITCSQISETNLLVLNITSADPENAYQFMISALNHYDEVSKQIFSNAKVQVLQDPTIPTSPSNQPSLRKYRYYLALFGAAAMSGFIVLLYIFRHTVKTSKGAHRQLDGRILGIIPYEKSRKNNKSLLISSPTVSMNYAESMRRLSSRLERHLRKNNLKTLLISSIAENEGKSTIAANISMALAEKKQKVLLVDFDVRKPAQYKIFKDKIQSQCKLDDVLNKKIKLTDGIEYDDSTGLYTLFVKESGKNYNKLLNNDGIQQMFTYIKKEFDYIIVDCSPMTVSTDVELLMGAVDSVLLVVRQNWSDIRVINDSADLIWQNDCDFSGYALNMFMEETLQKDKHYGYGNYQKGGQ